MGTEVKFTDNSGKVLDEMARKKILALAQIGMIAEKYAKENCPVDTGRLRNSITYATKTDQGTPNQSGGAKADSEDYKKKSTPDENSVYIGTNVVYAPKQEYGDSFHHTTGGAHFLKNAATSHGDEYKSEVEKIMKA